METCVYKTVQGCDVRADVYPAARDSIAPVIVWIHGGALMGGSRNQIRPVLRDMLAERGFAQVSIDYRLAPETKLPGILDDVRDAFAWVRGEAADRFRLDGSRVGVVGGSAGGYLALMTGFTITPRPKAIVSYYGYGDIAGAWYAEPDTFYNHQLEVSREEALSVIGTTPLSEQPEGVDRFRFYLYCRQKGLWPQEVAGLDPHTQRDAFTPYCPVRNITPEFPPTLLFHGTFDTDVPWQQSADMAAALQKAGVVHDFVSIPEGAHGFDGGVKAEDRHAGSTKPGMMAFEKTLAFFEKYV